MARHGSEETGPVKLGLVVNPMAGIGGRVGLKGSDGPEIQRLALSLGAVPQALERAAQALARIKPTDGFQIITYPGEMGEDAAMSCSRTPVVIGSVKPGESTREDTMDAARDMLGHKVKLLLFAGGDGTARDIYNAVGPAVPVLGIPAGVKIHSAVFATSPISAGGLASAYLQDQAVTLREAEVMDIDEEAVRRGVVSAKLYGYLRIPFQRRLVQGLKTPSGPGEAASLRAIARHVIGGMEHDWLYVIGPGTTTRAITSELGLTKTLLGVDVVQGRRMIATDVNETQLLKLLEQQMARIVVSPIGGQGFILGRGNQQISPAVIRKVLPQGGHPMAKIVVVSTPGKVQSLRGRPLLVDTGDQALDRALSGYIRVVTGFREEIVYRVAS